MNKKSIIISFIAIVFMAFSLSAQNLTNSPYSRYGIGDLQVRSFGRSTAMGNVGIGLQPNSSLNIINPAASSGLLKYTFLFEAGFAHKTTKYISSSDYQIGNTNALSYLAMGFNINDWWASGFGILPVSSVGYTITNEDSVILNSYMTKYSNRFSGNGGLYEVYWNNSFKFLEKFAVGINTSYMFGSLDRTYTESVSDSKFSSAVNQVNRTIINDFNYQLGVQYTDSLNKKTSFTVGAVFNNEKKMKSRQTLFTTFAVFQNGLLLQDTLLHDTLAKGHIVLPTNYGLGVSFTFDNRLTLAADYYKQNWSKSTILGQSQSLTDSWMFGLGAEYAESRIGMEYWKIIRYRLGGYYGKSYLALMDQEQHDYGISFGIGLPLKHSSTQINISCSLGTKGKPEGSLLQEKYAILSVNFNMLDAWFIKRRFN